MNTIEVKGASGSKTLINLDYIRKNFTKIYERGETTVVYFDTEYMIIEMKYDEFIKLL